MGNVFEVLDSDNDGTISANNMDVESLNANLRDFFHPLIVEIHEKGIRLGREDFIESSLKLYEKLTPTQRNSLIEAGKITDRSSQDEDYSFRPSISERSEELARHVRPSVEHIEDLLLDQEYGKRSKERHSTLTN